MRRVSLPCGGTQRCERENPTLTLVVGPHHDGDVFDRHDQQQRIDDQREHTQHVLVCWCDGMRTVKALPHGIQRACTDVTVNHSHGGEGQCGDVRATRCRQAGLQYADGVS